VPKQDLGNGGGTVSAASPRGRPPPKRCRTEGGIWWGPSPGARGGRKLGKLRLWRNTAHKASPHGLWLPSAVSHGEGSGGVRVRGCGERKGSGGPVCLPLPPTAAARAARPTPRCRGSWGDPSHCKGLSYAAEEPGSLPTGAMDTRGKDEERTRGRVLSYHCLPITNQKPKAGVQPPHRRGGKKLHPRKNMHSNQISHEIIIPRTLMPPEGEGAKGGRYRCLVGTLVGEGATLWLEF